MITRQLQASIARSLETFPVCGLIGSRQVGKSTLARAIAGVRPGGVAYLDLELPSDLQKLSDPELYLQQHTGKLVVIDEIQRKPDLFTVIRAMADRCSRNGCYLILGSASPALIRQSSESLAGRIQYLELPPLLASEVGGTMLSAGTLKPATNGHFLEPKTRHLLD